MSRRIPKLCYHKRAKQWYATLDGVEVYFGRDPNGGAGKTPPAEVRKAYEAAIRDHLARRADVPTPVGPDPSLAELWLAYAEHCASFYVKRGKQTTEVGSIRDACKVAARLYGGTKVRDFSPLKLRDVRKAFVERGWSRKHVNNQVARLRGMFSWGVSHELVGVDVLRALETVAPLDKGRPAWPGGPVPAEGRQVRPVEAWAVAAILPRLPESLRALVYLHWYTGCRAAEACVAHVEDIDFAADPANGLWHWSPREYKTEHLDEPGDSPLTHWLGPGARLAVTSRLPAALRPPPCAYGTRERERYARLYGENPAPVGWLFPTRGRGSGHWTTSSYRRAVKSAIDKANAERAAAGLPPVPHWSPLMVRHTRGTLVRKLHEKGLEAAQQALRHKRRETTERYAEPDEGLARDVAKRFG